MRNCRLVPPCMLTAPGVPPTKSFIEEITSYSFPGKGIDFELVREHNPALLGAIGMKEPTMPL